MVTFQCQCLRFSGTLWTYQIWHITASKDPFTS